MDGGGVQSWPALEFRSYKDTVGHPFEVTKWATILGRPIITNDKHSTPLWAPIISHENRKRYEDVQGVSALVLDYDDGTPIEVAQDTWSSFAYILHTSWSHTDEVPRFRVVLPFDPVWPICSVDKYEEVWRWANIKAGRELDGQCKNHNRLWFKPAAPSKDSFVLTANPPSVSVRWLDPNQIECKPEPKKRRTFGPVTVRSPAQAERVVRDRLLHDPETRERLMEHVGAHREGLCAKGALCPECGDSSVVWVIDPVSAFRAWCNHRKSCGWRGHLWELQ